MNGMKVRYLVLVVIGVLLAGGSTAVFANEGPAVVGLAMLVSGLVLTVLSAARVGRDLPLDRTLARTTSYPARLEAQLDPSLSRWMWLLKWLLAVPHYALLIILWVAFVVVTVVAGIAILATGRYPASLFAFAVGVLRWNWRVSFYASGVLGSDKYPPFTLDHADYPADFDIAYPAKLSRWRVLVKSWLFALPHLLIIAAVTGSSASVSGNASLLGLLVFVAAAILLFTGVYRLGLFNLLMGAHRWIYRVSAYVALMRDEYPPFKLDQGALEPTAR